MTLPLNPQSQNRQNTLIFKDVLAGIFLAIINSVEKYVRWEVFVMAEIKWGNNLDEAIRMAKRENKPVFLDFWFDG